MADKKISQLTAKGTDIAANDLVEISESNGAGGYVTKSVTGANILASKQDTLVSGTNIKTINGSSVLGSGNLVVTPGVASLTATSPVVATGTSTPDISLASGYGDTQNPYASKTANHILAAPNGTAGVPTFRAIVASDVPTLNQSTTGNAATVTTNANLTGPVTSTGNATAIANGAISNAMLANGAVANLSGTNTGDNATNSQYSGLVSNATHTGDAEGNVGLTVKGINGTILSNLNTGILKNTTGTGVPSIAVAADFPILNQNTTGTAGSTATLATARTISMNGDVAYTSPAFDGSANVLGTATLASIGVAGTYTKVTTDAKGRVTVGANLTSADVPTLNQNTTGTAANVTGIVAVANGGTGTATPSLVAGTNVTITGTFPNQTINSSGGGVTSPAGSNTQIQYNNSGVFGASSKFSWSNANEGLSIISESGATTRGLALHQHQTGPQSAVAQFFKSRGTNASPTAVIAGDIVGAFNFRPYIGTVYGQDQCLFGASMTSTTGVSQFFIAGTTGSNYTPNLLVAENGNVTVGNLGTGTIITSLILPTSKLQVAGNAAIGFTTATAAPTNGLSVSGTVNIGTNTSVTTAALQVSSTTQGFLPPVMTTTQRIAIVTPAAGLIVYDTTDNKHYGYNGTTWNAFY